jgi:predicted phosphate transport protein (TIGR00153 family)
MPVRFRLVPSDDAFFDLFNDSAANVAECARRLRDMLTDPTNPEAHDQVAECEHRGDELVRTIVSRLNSTFVTPFDREDIHALAEELDDVVDDLLEVSHRMQISGITTALPELKEQADLVVQCADETQQLMARLESMRGVQPHLEAIDRLESEGDAVYRRILARLFGGEFEALEVLRWKDVIESMEAALNTLEDISNVVESIVLKHA